MNKANRADEEGKIAPESAKKRKLNVLVVDDDEFLAGIYILTLQKAGHDIILVQKGTDGIKAAETRSPDVIVLDVLMPGMDGFQVLRTLKENKSTRDIPVIMLTTLSAPEDIEYGKSLGAVAYLTKTTTLPEDLAQKLDEISSGKIKAMSNE